MTCKYDTWQNVCDIFKQGAKNMKSTYNNNFYFNKQANRKTEINKFDFISEFLIKFTREEFLIKFLSISNG